MKNDGLIGLLRGTLSETKLNTIVSLFLKYGALKPSAKVVHET